MDAAVYRDWQEQETARLAAELERRHREQSRVEARDRELKNKRTAERKAAARLRIIEKNARRKAQEERAAAREQQRARQQEKTRRIRASARRAMNNDFDKKGFFERFLIGFYENIYFIGAYIQRDVKTVSRRIRHGVCRFWHDFMVRLDTETAKARARIHRALKTLMDPYAAIGRGFSALSDNLRAVRANATDGPTGWQALREFFSAVRIPFNHVANTFLPLLGIGVLVVAVNFFSNIQFALSVEYCGRNIGYIASENVFYAAQDSMMDRLIKEEYIAPEDSVPSFQLIMVEKSKLIDAETLSDKLVAASGNDIATADGIYIDDQFYGAVPNGDEFLIYLDGILDGYRSGEENEVVQFVKNISVRSGVYPVSSVMQLFELKNALNEASDVRNQKYTVQSGDTLYSIAVEYDTTVSRLRELNDMDEGDSIYGGQKLVVGSDSVASGLGIQVTRRETYQEDVAFDVTYVDNDRYPAGYTETISAGIPGKQWVTADVTYVDGDVVNTNVLSTSPISDPVSKRMLRGTMPTYTSGQDNVDGFIWPIANGAGRFNGSIGSYAGHTGMDIAISVGAEVVASRGGYIEYATNISIWPYGKQVYIRHPDGTATRYAHMSRVTVKSGQSVAQGTVIGKSGSTGNSSGPHLHFEIWVGNRYMAPEKYIGYHG